MIKILNFILNVESWARSQPKKFWRHCWNMGRFVCVWFVADMLLEAANQFMPLAHYTLISVCLYAVLALGFAWFIRRAYVGMERDMDFYMED